MSRTILKIPFSDYEQANTTIRTILTGRGFNERVDNDGVYWQKGNGFRSAPKYVKYEFSEKEITLQSWISNFGIEMNLSGIYGTIPKRELLEIIQQIKFSVRP